MMDQRNAERGERLAVTDAGAQQDAGRFQRAG
jgi:hypothetical protein